MGGAASLHSRPSYLKAQEEAAHARLSKDDIKELYEHLSVEYTKKVRELATKSKSAESAVEEDDGVSSIASWDTEEMISPRNSKLNPLDDFEDNAKDTKDEENQNGKKETADGNNKNDGKQEEKTVDQNDKEQEETIDVNNDKEDKQEETVDQNDKKEELVDINNENESKSEENTDADDENEEIAELAPLPKTCEKQNPNNRLTQVALPSMPSDVADKIEKEQKKKQPKFYKGAEVQRKLVEYAFQDQPQLLSMKVKINPKALKLLGDDELDERMRKHISSNTKVTPKVLAKLGEAYILPEKAKKTLGDDEMTPEQRRAMLKSEEEEERKREEQKQKDLQKVLKQKPTDPGLTQLTNSTKVNGKAIKTLGEDEALMDQVRSQVTKDMTKTSKTFQMTGEAKILPKQIYKRRGSEMSAEQKAMMLKAEKKEEKLRKKTEKKEFKKVLKQKAPEKDIEITESVKRKNNKLTQLGGTSLAPSKAKHILGDEMTPDQRKKMLEANLDKKKTNLFSVHKLPHTTS